MLSLFSSKSNLKKSTLTTDKFSINDQHCSNELRSNLPKLTSTLTNDSRNFQLSVLSNKLTTNNCQIDHDYATLSKPDDVHSEETSYCRLNHWFLLSSKFDHRTHPNRILTHYDNNKQLSNDSFLQSIETTFLDSCESLTVSVDFHVPVDELMTDYDDTDEQTMVIDRNKIPCNS